MVAAEERYVNPIEFRHDLEACDTISFIYKHDDNNGHSGLGLFGGRPCDILFFLDLRDCHMLIRTDNISVISYLNRQGGICSHSL